MLNILQIHQNDNSGGATLAALRHHDALTTMGHTSRMLVANKKSSNASHIEAIPQNPIEPYLGKLTWQLGLNDIHIFNTRKLRNHPWFQEADIIHFHNLHAGYFNYLSIPKIGEQKPIVWTLHDMWSFTGHCSYSFDCEKWKRGCGQCPYPETYPYIARDNTRIEWRLKKRTYAKTKLRMVTPSQWLGDQVKDSILSDHPLEVIAYSVDTEIYKPDDKEQARQRLNLRHKGHVFLSTCADFAEVRKGGPFLLEALAALPKQSNPITVLLMGKNFQPPSDAQGIEFVNLGYVSDEAQKATVYSASDAMLFTSQADNLPLVIQESICCGTPVIATCNGGVPEMVIDSKTGYLVRSNTTEDYAQTIQAFVEENHPGSEWQKQCRSFGLKHYHSQTQANHYVEIYRQLQSR